MAVGKNKRLSKKGKGAKKKATDPFLRKEWYDVKAPSTFAMRQVGKTFVSRTQGTKIASDGLKGRVVEVSLAELQKDEDQAFRKMKLRIDEVQGRNCLTTFHGMTFTSDKLRSLIRKWQTLIEAQVDVKTTDGYTVRMFCIGFTKKRQNAVTKTCYAKSSQIKMIRKKMVEIMTREAAAGELKDLVAKFIPEVIGKEIEKSTQGIYPLQNVFIRKCKVVKVPKFDISKLLELHEGHATADVGTKVARPEDAAAAAPAAHVEGAVPAPAAAAAAPAAAAGGAPSWADVAARPPQPSAARHH